MIGYILGTVVVVFGGVALLIFLALSSNRGTSTQPPSQPTQPQPQMSSVWEKWGKRIGWVIFTLVILDLLRKFVFPLVPIEWKEWLPGFSWNTIEVAIALVGVIILWGKRKKASVEQGGEGKKTLVVKENYAAEKVVVAMVLLVGFFFFGLIPYETSPPVPPEDMLYVPLWGLVKASGIGLFIALMWSFFVETETTNGAIFAILLTLCGGLIIFFLSIKGYWFAPLSSDPCVPMYWILGGVAGAIAVVHVFTKNIEYSTITLLVAIAVWLPQLASKSPALIALTHAVFR